MAINRTTFTLRLLMIAIKAIALCAIALLGIIIMMIFSLGVGTIASVPLMLIFALWLMVFWLPRKIKEACDHSQRLPNER
ncbi:MAG: hypothetical protein EXS55_04695 [Candidatus Magasanikbacteria bacterium]|nr:hypothetical protein [Candidatus Magasanikbacteria bacterium]